MDGYRYLIVLWLLWWLLWIAMIIRYKDEPSNSFVELLGDADLETAIRRNAKLMLYVSTP